MLTLSLLLLLAPLSVLTRPTLSPRQTPNIKSIYDFTNFNLENIAPRSNGHLLLSATNQPYLCDLDPSASTITPTYLPHLSEVTSALGIAETSQDIFAVAAGNYSSQDAAVAGSFAVFSVNMNTPQPTVKLITKIPEAGGLNGAAPLTGNSGTVLVADSILGAVWKVNVATGQYSIAVQDSALAPDASAAAGTSIGINGLRTVGSSMYFTNSYTNSFGRIPLNSDGTAAGAAVILAHASSGILDDFDMDPQGDAWIATHHHSMTEVASGGAMTSVTGGANTMVEPTSARYGRGAQTSTLYVVSAGNGTFSGQIASMST